MHADKEKAKVTWHKYGDIYETDTLDGVYAKVIKDYWGDGYTWGILTDNEETVKNGCCDSLQKAKREAGVALVMGKKVG